MFVSYMIACICKFLVISSSSFSNFFLSIFLFGQVEVKEKKNIYIKNKIIFLLFFLLSDERCASGSMMTACNTSLHLVKFDRKFVRTFDLWGSWKWNKKEIFAHSRTVASSFWCGLRNGIYKIYGLDGFIRVNLFQNVPQ